RSVLALPVLTGQIGIVGSGVMSSLSGATGFALDGPPSAGRRKVNMNHIGSLLPEIRVLFVQGSNPAVTAPNQRLVLEGLARQDLFTVVHDQVLTDTALLADVVLPATTHFEADDLAGSYGSFTLQRVAPVIDRVGESRTNDEVGAALAARLGLDLARYTADPVTLMSAGLGGGELPVAGSAEILHSPGSAVQFRDTFPSFEDRKARLAPPILRDRAVPTYRELDSPYPLALITPATHRTINSMFGEFNAAEACVRVHPDDAAPRDVGDGDIVRMWNDLGSIEVVARIDADLRPGVVSMPKGLWRRDVPGGLTANALVPDSLNDLAGGACFNDARVEIERV
ncbi:MAG TPA: molybdopterin dinucleotide binding domain-containing protein, partial [Acidimicrobiales bacterium]|nr:molybdopterin dinucleotide binding domain-containing protein [Acidimicrobiales bacterium]